MTGCANSDMSSARTSRLSFVRPITSSVVFRNWPPNWFVSRSMSLLLPRRRPCTPRNERRRRYPSLWPARDPLGTGLVESLARPGGNVTGLSAATAELAGKSVDLVRETLPYIRRVAALADPTNPFSKSFLDRIHLSALAIGIEVHVAMVGGEDEFNAAFSEMKRPRVEAVIVQPTLPRKRAVDLALEYRLPSVRQ